MYIVVTADVVISDEDIQLRTVSYPQLEKRKCGFLYLLMSVRGLCVIVNILPTIGTHTVV